MRKLLYLAVGAALLSAPAAFAQDESVQGPPPSPPMDQSQPPPAAMTDSQGNPVAPPGATLPGQVPPDQSAPPSATMPPPNDQTNPGARLFTSQTEVNGQQLQVISNAPVPDTKAARAKYRPLSAAGRRTRAAGN
jgi:hypothetical protein